MPKPGKNQEDIQALNRMQVIRVLHRMRICSRAELARQTGLTKASITGIVHQLIEAGVVREEGFLEDGKAGRRSMGLSLCTDQYLCIGLRLTRRRIRAGLFDIGGEICTATQRVLPRDACALDALNLMKEAVDELIQSAGQRRVLGIGIAAPGPILIQEGKNAYMSAFPGWESISIPQELEKAFGIPARLEHDGVCYALTEWWNRAPGDEPHLLLCILAGQGIGAGILMDGVPVRGALGCAGEIGHMSIRADGPRCDCGNFGCLENYVSALALERELEAVGESLSAEAILLRVRQGDETAGAIFRRQARELGYGVVNLVNLLNPDHIVITDELAACSDLLFSEIDTVLRTRISSRIYEKLRLTVRPDSPFRPLQAAASLITDRFLSDPAFVMQHTKGE